MHKTTLHLQPVSYWKDGDTKFTLAFPNQTHSVKDMFKLNENSSVFTAEAQSILEAIKYTKDKFIQNVSLQLHPLLWNILIQCKKLNFGERPQC